MARVMYSDLDYLAARVHGRRSRGAEAERLDALCQLRTIPELCRAVFPAADIQTCAEFQRRATEGLLLELFPAPPFLDQAGKELLDWMLVRFQVEDIKVLLRGLLDQTSHAELRNCLIALPEELTLDVEALLSAGTLERFVDRLPLARPQQVLRSALERYRDQSRPFCFEIALDRGYFQELLARGGRLAHEDREVVGPLIEQEVKLFLLQLVVRGRFGSGLPLELLQPLHLGVPGLPPGRFKAMLTAPDLRAAAKLAVGRVIDAMPAESAAPETTPEMEAAELEVRAWQRLLRLANRAFRRSHMGLGAILGYVGIRRVEVMNLITLSEGIRAGVAPEAIRDRLIPRREREGNYV